MLERTASDGDSMVRVGAWAGLASIVCYALFFTPLPQAVLRNFAFAFGLLLIAGILGIHAALADHADGPGLRLGTLFGIAAGVIVNILLVVQLANNAWGSDGESGEAIHAAVNRVQAAMDVSWDLFIGASGALLALSMWRHRRFANAFAVTGVLAAMLLLGLNLYTFPDGPAYAGLFDPGPVLALWFSAVFVKLLTLRR